ncbi:MAG: FAD:protein FMN transferase [Calditrichia bacterium]
MKKTSLSLLLTFLLVTATLFTNCSEKQRKVPVSKAQPHMGTYFTITSYDFDKSEAYLNTVLDSAFFLIAEIDSETSSYGEQSITAKLNAQNGTNRRIALPEHAANIVRQSLAISKATQGAFDITLWPVFQMWDFGKTLPNLPDSSRLATAVQKVNYKRLILAGKTLSLPAGVEIDLGGINKGYAVEAVRAFLKARGLQNFLIDASGNLGIEWNRQDSIDVSTRHPRTDAQFWGKFKINKSCGLATSGDYHFYFMKDRVRYHHILNPATGMPARPMASATIIAKDAMIADGLSTAIFVMGPKKGAAYIEDNPDLDGILIYSEGDMLKETVSSGLKDIYKQVIDETTAPK